MSLIATMKTQYLRFGLPAVPANTSLRAFVTRFGVVLAAVLATAGTLPAQDAGSPAVVSNPMASTNAPSPLHFDPGPTGGETAIRSFLRQNSRQLRFGSADTDNLTIQPPLPVYRLPAKNAVVTTGLEAATRDGFLFPVLQGDKEVVDVFVHKTGTGTANTRNIFGEWFPENGPGQINNALKEVSAMEQVKAGSYEARLAVFPYPRNGNPAQAVWLKSKKDTNDLIYPMGQLPNIQDGRTYAPNEFFDILYPQRKENPRTN